MNTSENLLDGRNNQRKGVSQEKKPNLSRSPHPYHRRSESIINEERLTRSEERPASTSPSSIPTSRFESSESGTEADDERGVFLKSLPAPPIRARKGLRGTTPVTLTPVISPLPTPPIFVKEGGNIFFGERWHGKNKRKRDLNDKNPDESYRKRKRQEVSRRCVEILLFVWMTYLIWRAAYISSDILQWTETLNGFYSLTIILYCLYPVRRLLQAHFGGHSLRQAFRIGFHIPSKFDPGPLIYPVYLPTLISISLFNQNSAFLLANIVSGLSSVPYPVLLFGRKGDLNILHWILSLLPLNLAVLWSPSPLRVKPLGPKLHASGSIAAEELALIYPLQKSLETVIEYLTTTSLDSSELQILSSGMVNILLFARSPQAQILKALLWVGALCLFITCRQVLGWEVALARTPLWKLVRRKASKRGLFYRLDQMLCSFVLRNISPEKSTNSSDSDDNEHIANHRLRWRGLPKLEMDGSLNLNYGQRSATVKAGLENGPTSSPETQFSLPSRRNTFTAFDRKLRDLTNTVTKRVTKPVTTNSAFFLSLTVEQARVRKFLYAGYTYITTILIILIPVRTYVSTYALLSCEPFGWAIGYLFGNIPELRLWVVSNNMEKWIRLPDRPALKNSLENVGLVEYIRKFSLGEANTRLCLCLHCLVVLLVGIAIVFKLTSVVEVDTRRKVFHGVMVAILLPTIFIDPCFIALALALILAIFLLLDLFRASQLPPISRPLTNFLAPYVDGRDHRGPVIVSHIFLLIGCAIPLWLSLAGHPRTGSGPWVGWDTPIRDLSMVSGVVCVGMGDAAASLVGRRYGKTKWYWGGGKSLEGSAAFAVAVTCGLMASYFWLRLGGWILLPEYGIMKAIAKSLVAGLGASLLESTLTAANDNVVVPVALWLLVRGLKI